VSFFRRKPEFVVQVRGQIGWKVAYDPESSLYIGICTELNLNASGDTFAEFQAVANDAMAGLFKDLFDHGEFEAFLRTNGWQHTPLPAPGVTPRFDVPFDIHQAQDARQLAYA
jgi:hypothetical protein